MTTSFITTDNSFRHKWQAEILLSRPLILPLRHFTYPREAEEVERGALELLIHPANQSSNEGNPERSPSAEDSAQDSAQEFLATCALGFRDPSVPTGVWTVPNPQFICAVSGGYAYLIDTADPRHFTMIPYRPVLEVRAVPERGLLLFVGHRSILAWGSSGQAWESQKLSDEGLTITVIEGPILHGRGWNMLTDKETPFALDLSTGRQAPLSD